MKVIDPPDKSSFKLPGEDSGGDNHNSAANLVRKKLDSIYNQEPDVVDEAIESIRQRKT